MRYLIWLGTGLLIAGAAIALFAFGRLLFWCVGYPVTPEIHACEMQSFLLFYRGVFVGMMGGLCLAPSIFARRAH